MPARCYRAAFLMKVLLLVQPVETALAQEFSFQSREGLLWVKVEVAQSRDPLNFLFDTGAGVSVLNLSTAKRLGLRAGRPVRVDGVAANTQGYWPQPFAAKASGVPLPGNCLVVDLTALSGACNGPVDGLIGADFIGSGMLQIDFATHKIRLLRSYTKTQQEEQLPLKVRNRALRVPIRVNDSPAQWFRLDTGCASSFQWVTSQPLPQATSPQVAVALGDVAIKQTRTTVRIGDSRFDSVPTGLHDRPIFPGEAGLLGNGILSRFECVTIDPKGGRVLLRKRAAEAETN